MHNDHQDWEVIEKTAYYIKLRSKCGYYQAFVKADGCVDLIRSYNAPFSESETRDWTNIHICDLNDFLQRLEGLADRIYWQMPNTDAAKKAREASFLFAP